MSLLSRGSRQTEMYKILFRNNLIGTTKLEIGDPPMGCVAGLINSCKPIKEMTSFIAECGGEYRKDFWSLKLNEDFDVLTKKGLAIPYLAGSIRVCPELGEAEIEILGIPYSEYEDFFPEHVKKYKNQFD